MGLKALRIVQEEYQNFLDGIVTASPSMLLRVEALRDRIVERVEQECVEVDPKALLRDHMRKGGDPATFELPVKPKCTWCNCGADAVDDFWVQEIGEFRDSKESLCSNHIEELESARPPISVRRVT